MCKGNINQVRNHNSMAAYIVNNYYLLLHKVLV